jgi:hypothetical protein
MTTSTAFGALQGLRFHEHALSPQDSALFLVQPFVSRAATALRERALTAIKVRPNWRAIPKMGFLAVKN